MVKKSKKGSIKRSRLQATIQQGKQYIELSTKLRMKKNIGTKTMKQIARSSIPILKTRNAQNDKKKIIKKDVPKKSEIKAKKNPSSSHVEASKISKSPKKTSKAIGSSSKISSKVSPPAAVAPPAPTLAIAPIARTGSRSSNVGKVAQLSKSKSKDAQIPAFGFIDVCFCIDSTGSMSSELAQVQQVIKAVIQNIESKVRTEGLQLRFAIVSYRDHPPQDSSYVTNHLDFTDQYEAIQYLKKLSAMGGGDEPEAAHDGLMLSAQKLNWAQVAGTPVLRYIFHIADAPPHGKEFLNPEAQEGCLCGLKTDDVIRQINKKSIHYRLIKVRNNFKVDEMQKIFKSKVGDFDSTDINHAKQLNVKVSDMIIHEVLPDYA